MTTLDEINTDIKQSVKDLQYPNKPIRQEQSAKEAAMRIAARALSTAIRAIETMPAHGSNPNYAMGWAQCKEAAVSRLHSVLVQTMGAMDKAMPNQESKECQEQQPPQPK